MASLAEQHILRLRRTDNKKPTSEHILVNVTKNGRNDLDLRLIGTDKEALFETSIKQSAIKSLQERNFTGNLEDWKALLKFTFFHSRPDGAIPDYLQGVEAVGAISGSTLTITIRKNIGGITQRLGTISLKETDEEDLVNGLDWTEVAATASDELRAKVETLQASVESQKNELAKLSTELDMLVKAKKEHENEMLSKFAALLNSKKLKIRDQQRLLQNGNIDTDTAAIGDVSPMKTPTARSSRSGKRKANGPPQSASPDTEDEGGDNPDEASTQQHSPEPDEADVATETEDEDEDEEATRKSAPSIVASQASTRGRSRRANEMVIDNKDESPPPRRALPFNKRKSAKTPSPPPAPTANQDEDDVETEDEL